LLIRDGVNVQTALKVNLKINLKTISMPDSTSSTNQKQVGQDDLRFAFGKFDSEILKLQPNLKTAPELFVFRCGL
jgi:hypothetical protein